jgi:hypothetical protein
VIKKCGKFEDEQAFRGGYCYDPPFLRYLHDILWGYSATMMSFYVYEVRLFDISVHAVNCFGTIWYRGYGSGAPVGKHSYLASWGFLLVHWS